MQGFSDRRPAVPVAPGELRSKEALATHLASHHAGWGAGTDVSHSEMREFHAEHHTDPFAVHQTPHTH